VSGALKRKKQYRKDCWRREKGTVRLNPIPARTARGTVVIKKADGATTSRYSFHGEKGWKRVRRRIEEEWEVLIDCRVDPQPDLKRGGDLDDGFSPGSRRWHIRSWLGRLICWSRGRSIESKRASARLRGRPISEEASVCNAKRGLRIRNCGG
jgi:hypothetical protein